MRVVVLRFPYPGCDCEVGGDMDRGKVAEQKVDTCFPGNGQKQSDAGQHCSREEGDTILPEHPFRKDLMF